MSRQVPDVLNYLAFSDLCHLSLFDLKTNMYIYISTHIIKIYPKRKVDMTYSSAWLKAKIAS